MTIEKCKYIIRKGEEPAADRSNIFDWTPSLAQRDDKFEAFREDLPVIVPPPLSEYQERPKTPTEDIKRVLIFEAIKKLEKEDFTKGGVPKISAIQAIVGFDIDALARDDAFEFYKSEMERKNGNV
jgi:hypothetical protein